MTETLLCRCCGQPLPPKERAGVYLPSKKAAIFDIVRKHPTITVGGIVALLNDGSTNNCVRQHIYQINAMLASTNVRIDGREIGQQGQYSIFTTPKRRKKKPLPRRQSLR